MSTTDPFSDLLPDQETSYSTELQEFKLPYTGKSLAGVRDEVADNFQAMADEYYQLTGNQVQVNDAHRTRDMQTEAYRTKPNLAAPPGQSRHEDLSGTGSEALDIDETQANDLDRLGLLSEYGFHRPMLGQGKSGKVEKWHLEPIDIEKMINSRAGILKTKNDPFRDLISNQKEGDPFLELTPDAQLEAEFPPQPPSPKDRKGTPGILQAGNIWAQDNPEAAAMAGAPEAMAAQEPLPLGQVPEKPWGGVSKDALKVLSGTDISPALEVLGKPPENPYGGISKDALKVMSGTDAIPLLNAVAGPSDATSETLSQFSGPAGEMVGEALNLPFVPLQKAIGLGKETIKPYVAQAFPKATEQEVDMALNGLGFAAELGVLPSYFGAIGKGLNYLKGLGRMAYYRHAPDVVFKAGAQGGLPDIYVGGEPASEAWLARRIPEYKEMLQAERAVAEKPSGAPEAAPKAPQPPVEPAAPEGKAILQVEPEAPPTPPQASPVAEAGVVPQVEAGKGAEGKPRSQTEIVKDMDEITAASDKRRDESPSPNKGLYPSGYDWMTPEETTRMHELQLELIPIRLAEITGAKKRVEEKRAARVAEREKATQTPKETLTVQPPVKGREVLSPALESARARLAKESGIAPENLVYTKTNKDMGLHFFDVNQPGHPQHESTLSVEEGGKAKLPTENQALKAKDTEALAAHQIGRRLAANPKAIWEWSKKHNTTLTTEGGNPDLLEAILGDRPLKAKTPLQPEKLRELQIEMGGVEPNPVIQQALQDWNSGKTYVDGQGNYHIKREGKPNGPIAPWNKEVKKAFPDTGDFHKAAKAVKSIPEVGKGEVELKPPQQGEGLADAMKVVGAIKGAHLGKNPSGKYDFSGKPDSKLTLQMADGSDVPLEILKERQRIGFPAITDKKYGIKHRMWETPEEAISYAENRGLTNTIVNLDKFSKIAKEKKVKEVLPQKWQKGEIEIAYREKDVEGKKLVDAESLGPFAVTKNLDGPGFVVTHKPTGMKITTDTFLQDKSLTKSKARQVVEILNQSGENWEFDNPKTLPEGKSDKLISDIRAAIKDVQEPKPVPESEKGAGKKSLLEDESGAIRLSLLTPGLEAGRSIKQGIQSLVLPTAKSPEHLRAGEVLGSKLGTMHRQSEIAARSLKPDSKMFDKMGVHDPDIPLEINPGVKFMSDMSQGRPLSPQMQPIADKVSRLFDDRVIQLKKAEAPLETVRDNYFPGMWKQDSVKAFNQAMEEAIDAGKGKGAAEGGETPEAQNVNDWSAADKAWVKNRTRELMDTGEGSDKSTLSYLTRRPFKGKESFRKGKVFDDIMTGVEFGLEPISNNPLDLVKLKLSEMDRSIMANRAIQEWKKTGDVKFNPITAQVPEGWVKINDKYGTVYGPPIEGEYGRRTMGHYVAKAPVAEIMNNYLSSSLYNSPYFGTAYRGWMAVGNSLNQFQLGVFSSFHAGFTSLETQITSGAEVIKDIYGVARGNRSIKDLGKSVARYPLAMVNTARKGANILAEWNTPQMDVPSNIPVGQLPTTKEAKIAQVAKAAELAGAGFKMEQGLRTFQTDAMRRDWYGGNKVKAALRSPIALTEISMKPIMEFLVPRQKAGVFAEMAGRIMDQNPGKTMEELRPQLRQAWNRVDARLGQVRYDRLFINNAAKNVIQGLIRAPGWTGGTISEVGGAPKDVAKFIGEWAKEGKAPKDIPDRVAYVLSLLGTMAVANGLMTYAFTGERPEGMDWWAFRDGGKDDKGNPTRFLLPSYAKDIFAWYKKGAHTLLAKMHPLVSLAGEIAKNRDYYNNMIYDEEKGIWNQDSALRVGIHILKAYTPFWIRGAGEIAERGGGLKETLAESPGKLIAPQFGVMPATRAYTMTALDEVMSRYNKTQITRTPEKAEETKLRRETQALLRQGKEKQAIERLQEAIKSKKVDFDTADKWMEEAEVPAKESQFKRLPLEWEAKALLKANPEEYELLLPIMLEKIGRAKDADYEKAEPLIDQLIERKAKRK